MFAESEGGLQHRARGREASAQIYPCSVALLEGWSPQKFDVALLSIRMFPSIEVLLYGRYCESFFRRLLIRQMTYHTLLRTRTKTYCQICNVELRAVVRALFSMFTTAVDAYGVYVRWQDPIRLGPTHLYGTRGIE